MKNIFNNDDMKSWLYGKEFKTGDYHAYIKRQTMTVHFLKSKLTFKINLN